MCSWLCEKFTGVRCRPRTAQPVSKSKGSAKPSFEDAQRSFRESRSPTIALFGYSIMIDIACAHSFA